MTKKRKKPLLRSLLSWLGGKSLLKELILSMFPEDHKCFVEAFAGGASVYFAKQPSKVEVLNDVNKDLINFYTVVRDKYGQLIDSLRWELCSRKQFERYFRDLQNPEMRETLTDVELAKRFFYIIKLSFAGQGKSFGYGTTTKPKLNLGEIENIINKAHERLERTYIECLDYFNIIERYDREHTLFYLDPPYRTPSARVYAQFFRDSDFIELRDRLLGIKGKFILSLNKDDFIKDLFMPHFRVETVKTTYSVQANKVNKVEEYLIMNYDPPLDKSN